MRRDIEKAFNVTRVRNEVGTRSPYDAYQVVSNLIADDAYQVVSNLIADDCPKLNKLKIDYCFFTSVSVKNCVMLKEIKSNENLLKNFCASDCTELIKCNLSNNMSNDKLLEIEENLKYNFEDFDFDGIDVGAIRYVMSEDPLLGSSITESYISNYLNYDRYAEKFVSRDPKNKCQFKCSWNVKS